MMSQQHVEQMKNTSQLAGSLQGPHYLLIKPVQQCPDNTICTEQWMHDKRMLKCFSTLVRSALSSHAGTQARRSHGSCVALFFGIRVLRSCLSDEATASHWI